ncbi:MAG: Rieske (2Fe-2S) protein [Sporichthyaceae bacterium]
MSEPDGPDATRRTLLRGIVVLGAVGAGAGLSRLGEGTYELTSATAAESDVAVQSAPVETAAPAESAPSAAPSKAAAKAKSPKTTTSAKAAETTETAKSAKSGTSAKATETTPTAKTAKSTKAAKSAKSAEAAETADAAKPAKKPAKAAKAPKPAGTALGPANKIPVGGGAIYKDKRVVVTQPTAGQYKAFDALCTHANCLVDEVRDGSIHCPCHSAKFSIADGSVKRPSVARRPLNPKTVTEADGTLYLT